jgi:hypothetical protein
MDSNSIIYDAVHSMDPLAMTEEALIEKVIAQIQHIIQMMIFPY